MAASSSPPKAGNEILVPLFNAEGLGNPLTVTWSQNLSTRTAQYYATTADNLTSGQQCNLFIAAEYYKDSTKANPKHITRVEGYKLNINSAIQYGQKNVQGELRFLVYHDQERKPFQHRFIETALASTGAAKAKELAEKLGSGAIAGNVVELAKNFVGDYLRTF